jgi:hypothetical protein
MMLEMDADYGKGKSINGAGTTILPPQADAAAAAAANSIVVQASSPGLTSSQVTIKVSSNIDVDGVLAVASRSVPVAFVE